MPQITTTALTLLGGLGIFLLGMKHLSEGLQAVCGEGLRRFMGWATTSRLAGVGTGVVSTLITQSSAIITAMLVGFVSSGMMTLQQATSVIIGANIGTTGTVWIVALMPCPEILGLVGLAVGGLLYFFVRRASFHDLGLAVLGLGLVLLGVFFMSKGFAALCASEASRDVLRMFAVANFLDVFVVAFAAMIVSAAISSAATIAIAMILASQGLISYETAIASLFGANIGTTVSAWLAAIGGIASARRAALAHTLSNVIGSLVFLPLVLPVLVPFGKWLFPGWNIPVETQKGAILCGIMAPIAATDTIFAILRGLLIFPLVAPFSRLLQRIIPGRGEEKPHLSALNMRAKQSPVIACEQAMKEVQFMAQSGLDLIENVRMVLTGEADERVEKHIFHREDVLDNVQKEITEFIGKVMVARLPQEVADRARLILRLSDEFESVSDEAPAILKAVNRMKADGQRISDASSAAILSVHDRVADFATKVTDSFFARTAPLSVEAAQSISRDLHQFIRSIRQGQLGRVGPDDPTSPMRVLVELDILNAFERIRSYYLNIAESLVGGKKPRDK